MRGETHMKNTLKGLPLNLQLFAEEVTAEPTETEVEELIQDLPKSLLFKVLYAPGHTIDSAVFYFPKFNAAFVGDVIFKESVGRTDLEGGSWRTLENSIKTQVFTLPGETTLYPGHGPSTTVKYEKKYNPHFNLDF